MQIRLGYDIRFNTVGQIPFITLLNVHPSRRHDLLEPDVLEVNPGVEQREYIDTFGNICVRLVAPAGELRLQGSTLVQDSGLPDPAPPEGTRQHAIEDLPDDTLRFLLPSRYCETDLLSNKAVELFGNIPLGWERVQAITTWVNQHVTFGYHFARPTKTALEVLNDRQGVCRDFQHLAIVFCRCMNIPARYATGYLGDIGVPVSPSPMDFSAWFEVYLGDRWWTCDARHNKPRIGRVLQARGRDAADAAITTSFGTAILTQFTVVTDEITAVAAVS